MRKFLQLKQWLLVLCMVLGASNLWGADTAVYTLDFTTASPKNQSYTTTFTWVTGWDIYGAANNNGQWAYLRFGGKSSTTTKVATITATSSVSSAIDYIVIQHKGKNNNSFGVSSVKLETSANSSFSSATTTTVNNPSISTSTAGTITITPTTQVATNSYYKISITWTNGTDKNYGLDIEKVIFYQKTASVPVTGVTLPETAEVSQGSTTTLTATVAPNDATNKNVTWSSSDETVATVDANGVVTGVSQGTATITVTTEDGSYTATCTVTVTAPIAVTGVTLDQNTASVAEGNTVTLTATVAPSNAANKTVTWSTSDPSIATVSNGVVTGVAAGTATITVTTADGGHTATCTVTVTEVKGSAAHPYTVAEALAATPATGVYVTGVISSITEVSTQYKNATYNISDDGTTSGEMIIYRGRYIDDADFTSENQIGVGDRVVVTGELKLYSGANQMAQNNYIVSLTPKPASDLAKISDITLDFKNENLIADVKDYITSSSTGAYTYTVGDDAILEVDQYGAIMGLAEGTTTITVEQAADLNYKAGSVVINVTVNDTRVDATTIPGINISNLLTGAEDGTIEVVNPVKADAGVSFSYTSNNENVLLIIGTTYTVGEAGTANVTVTATASDSKLYKDVTATFPVTVSLAVKSDNVITAVLDNNSTVYGTALGGLVEGSTGFDGTITATSSNESVATVSVDAEGNVTIIPVAVGTTTITFSAAETATFNSAQDVTETITVTEPSATNTAPEGSDEEVLFSETWNNTSGTGGNDVLEEGDAVWSGSIATSSVTSDNDGWTLANEGGAQKCIKLGGSKSGKQGSATTPDITVEKDKVYTLTFKAAPWSSETTSMNVTVDGGSITGISTDAMTTQQWNNYSATITATSTTISITFAASSNRFFLDEVVVTKPASTPSESVTLNTFGYLAYASQNPMDFTNSLEAGYSAWQVTKIENGEITFDRITGAIAGGQGVLLKGDADTEISIPLLSSTTTLSGNKLAATLAPTYFEDETIYGFSGTQFFLNEPCILKANRAYIPASEVPNSSNVKDFIFVFNDDVTGIESIETMSTNKNATIYDLSGRRVLSAKCGLYIVNGKKMFVK